MVKAALTILRVSLSDTATVRQENQIASLTMAAVSFPVEYYVGISYNIRMTERDEIKALKAEIRLLKTQVNADRTDFEKFKDRVREDYMSVLKVKQDLGTLRRDLGLRKEIALRGSKATGARLVELSDRLKAVEAHVAASMNDLPELRRILGNPNADTPHELDHPRTIPRRK